jgi:alpha-L-rhamnosidase
VPQSAKLEKSDAEKGNRQPQKGMHMPANHLKWALAIVLSPALSAASLAADGTPDLTSYRRIILEPTSAATEGLLPQKPSAITRPRVIILSDFPPLDVIPGGAGYGPPEKRSDPDDVQSMVRFLVYANKFDVEGLVASAATFANIARKQNILDILDLYDRVDENLRKHDSRYPTADQLRAVTWQGRDGTWGKPANEIIGEGRDSEASEAIIKVLDRPDPRPVWVLVWGGPADLAQAIWKAQTTRSPAELERFLSKLRIFLIGLGNKPAQDGSGQWMLDNFPNLFVIVSQKTYQGMFAQNSPIGNLEWLNANVRQGRGPLGAAYPRSGFDPDLPGQQEGDTPSFLYLYSAVRGMNDPEKPEQESWGGQYMRRDPAGKHWYDGPGAKSVSKWLPDMQRDFATRMDWCVGTRSAEANSPVYLFSTFKEEQDGLRFAYSFDGYHWADIPGVFLRPQVGGKIMRDPSIVRGPDGMFHLVWTTAWRGHLGFGYAASKDLVHWSEQKFVPVMAHEPTTVNVWAPELFYDEPGRQFIICWASTIPGRYPDHLEATDNNHRMYYTTTRDFQTFAPTKLFLDPGFSVIDCSIAKDGERYVLVLKDNTRPERNLRVAFGDTPLGPWHDISPPLTDKLTEGPTALKLGDEWLIYYDSYGTKSYGALRTRDFQTFTNVTAEMRFPEGLRHGTIFRVTRQDLDRLRRVTPAPERMAAGARQDALSVADPRCEGLREAPQVATDTPRFSWRLVAAGRDVRQTAYQLRITEVDGRDRPLGAPVESARVESDQTQWVVLPGFIAKPRATYGWQVRVWDNRGNTSDWTELQRFGTGLLGERWPADWIGDGRTVPLFETPPARYFRGVFKVERPPVRAHLYVSALGLLEPWLNGQEVTEDKFIPGWPDYRRRVFYAAFDVTPLVRTGDNTLGMILGDGWYSGTMIPRHQFGQEAMLSAFLDLTDEEGRVTTIATSKDWQWTDAGPIRLNSIYHGETYDARRELAGWSDPGPSKGIDWRPVSVNAGRRIPASFTARMSPPVRRIETIKPVGVRRRGPDVHIYDIGQNMVGWVRLRVRAEAGREIKLRFAEMLEPDGGIHTGNLRTAKATAIYIAKGAGAEEWEPRFTYFGFRYVELSGVEQPLADAIEGVVVHTDLPRTGEFECSNPLLNQLWQNTLWSQKGNFLELPTDCPQRDERTGWTGDAQIFAPTAMYNMEAGTFFRQWLFSLRDGLRDDPRGGYPDVAPYTGFGHGSPGWAEAGVIVPWAVWLHTGDRRVLAENLPSIQHALELMAAQAPDGIRQCPPSWGDWLAPGFPRYQSPPRQDLIATAFFSHAADLAARIAGVLDRPELAASNRALRDRARAAYQKAFIAPDGRVADDVQTSYLLTLAFNLAPPAQREQIIGHLIRSFREKDNHLATGFLGTPLIAPVLTEIGRPDIAYTVLLQTTYPGWLFPVKNGATTIWERWDSWTPEGGFHKENMNSFNHYAYGSIVSWFYSMIAGLEPLPEAPGWKRFRVAPLPGGGLTHAAARLQTPHGEASSSWRVEDGRLRLVVVIPPNTGADVVLPVRGTAGILLDKAPLVEHDLAKVTVRDDGSPVIALPSGRYEFLLPESRK